MLNPFFYTIMGNNFQKRAFEQKARFKTIYRGGQSTRIQTLNHRSNPKSLRVLNLNKSIENFRSTSDNSIKDIKTKADNRILYYFIGSRFKTGT
jgi:hypothetical protein